MQKQLLFILLAFGLIGIFPARAQQDAQLSQYMFNPLYVNPAAAGLDGALKFQLHYRNQWTGYQTSLDGSGSLGTQIFNVSMPLNGLRSGVGLSFVNDKTPSGAGYQDLKLAYSFQLKLSDASLLSLGASGGFHIKNYDNSFRPRDENDPILDGLTGRVSQSKPDFSVGAIFKSSNFQIGASFNHVNQPEYNFGIASLSNKAVQTVNIHGNINYYLSEDLEIVPTALFKTDFKSQVLEGGAVLNYQEKYWFGGSYRLNDAGIIIAGISLLQNNALRIGYSLDLTSTRGASAKAPTSHEILLSYSLPAPKLLAGKKAPVRTPRFRK